MSLVLSDNHSENSLIEQTTVNKRRSCLLMNSQFDPD